MKRILYLISLVVFLGCFPLAFAATPVPPGNRNAEQPGVPGASARRTKANNTTYEAKYRKIYALIKNDGKLRSKIKQAASLYGIDPMHIVGAIVGEHTYNVDAYDRLQTYYVKAAAYLSNKLVFAYNGESVGDFVARPQFAKCKGMRDSYDLWSCREAVWNMAFRGNNVDGANFPNNRFSAIFFQPLYAGQTFGLGQLNPLTALQMSDLVSRISGLPQLDADDAQRVYETIMDPDLTLAYVAATLKTSIEAYKSIAGFDISRNPGVTATLYNVGNPEQRAYALKSENSKRQAAGEAPKLPEENYYGWLVNEKMPELQALF
ncbi:DUF1402 family protein [Mesorhizobium sp. NBSH29]|uniref:DUF1402 family protein n=1 Tax=Mesorhizobium sp. NBSH29 TaxID=2654249 RepID=UPI00189699E3|nr:DUF1402 family protein [Mesorhizobium sp. NBSH29]QPC86083.1 DUF1402 family protein [Mesorhizobium sp. NBSH29]